MKKISYLLLILSLLSCSEECQTEVYEIVNNSGKTIRIETSSSKYPTCTIENGKRSSWTYGWCQPSRGLDPALFLEKISFEDRYINPREVPRNDGSASSADMTLYFNWNCQVTSKKYVKYTWTITPEDFANAIPIPR